MKLLFDQNLSHRLCRQLADLFPGSAQVRLLGLDRADDRQVWDYAKANGFAVVTQDADYAELAALFGVPPKVVWLRGGNQPTASVEHTLRLRADIMTAFDGDPEAACLELY